MGETPVGPKGSEPQVVTKVSEEDRLTMLYTIDRLNATNDALSVAVRCCVMDLTAVKRDLRSLWIKIKKKHNLSSDINYNLDKHTGVVTIPPPPVKPAAPVVQAKKG